jgi:tRNA threonylcarbamoyladenosine biosynthesis protein TsaE
VSWPVTVTTDSPAATRAVAADLASRCGPGDIVLLIGELGAGKTVFAQGFAAALGVEGPVTSPTFTLVRQYACAVGAPVDTLLHADVYRTESLPEVMDLALAELVEERAIALVEWGDLAAPALGPDVLEVILTSPQPEPEPGPGSEPGSDVDEGEQADRRIISVGGRGRWVGRADEVADALGTTGLRVAP